MSSLATTAPIERVTVPLRPRTPAGCCDLAVMFYGRHLVPMLKLYLAVAGPATAFAYAFGRFVGADLALAIVAGMIVSKPLDVLTVAATARRTFGGPLERPPLQPGRTRTSRLHSMARGFVTAVALLAGGVLGAAVLDDAYGTGRLAALGPRPAAVIVSILSAIFVARAGLFVADRHAPGREVRTGLVLGVLARLVLATPLGLLFFDGTRAVGIVVALLWLPLALLIEIARSFRTERRALEEIDPALHTPQASRALDLGELAGHAIVITAAVAGLSLVMLSAIEFALTTAGLSGPLSGPIGDALDPEFFEPGVALAALGGSPLFAAAALAAGLLAVQLGRVAWFFAYLDARVRRDCWDMELLLTREARRLEEE